MNRPLTNKQISEMMEVMEVMALIVSKDVLTLWRCYGFVIANA